MDHMQWINDFQLFLLDFDGLLVNTEPLHYKAYLRLCENQGHPLNWSFEQFVASAHLSSEKLRQDIYNALPKLLEEKPNWEILYQEKKRHYLDLLKESPVELIPGVENFLKTLQKKQKKRCVVTHSPLEQIDCIRKRHPIFESIDHWITREDYQKAKPDPEPYLLAIKRYANPNDRIIGFEDSPRGISSLRSAQVTAVYVNDKAPGSLSEAIQKGEVIHLPSFEEIESLTLKA